MGSTLRLAKRIAESGVASRREAERLIETGRVAVDGIVVTTPVFFVSENNKVFVDGKEISQKSNDIVIWKFYKPKGVITTKRDPKNRRTVFDILEENGVSANEHRLLYIGRLDYNSEGLLLFSNNGDVARKMELPSSAIKRTYRARIFGRLSEDAVGQLKHGIIIDSIKYGQIDVQFDRASAECSKNIWITVTLAEGKNREIRKVMEHFNCTVNRLIRISYGPFNLGDLRPGEIQKATKQEMKKLLREIQ
jgi:23S rRNA pseudouridine2605 synthase